MNQVPEQQQQAHPAAVAQEFMRRADMKGGEVEAFGQTFNWLGQFLQNELIATPAEAHHALLEELKDLREFKRVTEEGEEKQEAIAAGDIPVLEPEEYRADAEAAASKADMLEEGTGTPEELDPVDSEASE